MRDHANQPAPGRYELTVEPTAPEGFVCRSCTAVNIEVVWLDLSQPTVGGDGRVSCQLLTTFTNRPVILQASSDLRTWTDVLIEQLGANNAASLVDPRPLGSAPRFYRALLRP